MSFLHFGQISYWVSFDIMISYEGICVLPKGGFAPPERIPAGIRERILVGGRMLLPLGCRGNFGTNIRRTLLYGLDCGPLYRIVHSGASLVPL